MPQSDPLIELLAGLPALLDAVTAALKPEQRQSLLIQADSVRREQISHCLHFVANRITSRPVTGIPDAVLLDLSRVRILAENAMSRLQTVPALVLNGPIIQLLPAVAENRLTKLAQLTADLPVLEARAEQIVSASANTLPVLIQQLTSALDRLDQTLLNL